MFRAGAQGVVAGWHFYVIKGLSPALMTDWPVLPSRAPAKPVHPPVHSVCEVCFLIGKATNVC